MCLLTLFLRPSALWKNKHLASTKRMSEKNVGKSLLKVSSRDSCVRSFVIGDRACLHATVRSLEELMLCVVLRAVQNERHHAHVSLCGHEVSHGYD